jgi:DNA-binding transcriptional MerR regulator
MTLQDLAEQAALPARTIRFYIARGLLPGPTGAGRSAAYGGEHLARLAAIKRLQKRGLTLTEMTVELSGEKAALPPASAWWQYPLGDDVMVQVRAGASPWRLRQIRNALEEMAARLNPSKTGDNGDE